MARRIRGLDADQRRAERREQLLDAALDLFAEHGYLGTSIEQICSTAYIGTKSFYEVFDSREDCYVALLQRTSERLEADMVAVAERAEGNERQAVPGILSAFAHALLDDPKIAKVTFGQAGGISETVERQRRTNRRWAAGFLVKIWDRYDEASADTDSRARYSIAIGLVGGLFDLISDWLLDADLTAPDQVDTLIEDLTAFYITVRRGLTV
jgi:AcrR family transcriptional regulator